MLLSPAQKASLRQSTKGAASALVEDMAYIREVLKRNQTSKGEIRRLSAVVRRIFVEDDLSAVAAPRLGKMTIMAPDLKFYYEAERFSRVMLFASGGAEMFGLKFGTMAYFNAGKPTSKEHQQFLTNRLHPDAPQTMIPLKISNFLSQRVLCYHGEWLTRRVAIKYIANYASGVHTVEPDRPEYVTAEAIREAGRYWIEGGKLHMHFLPELAGNSFKSLIEKRIFEPTQKAPQDMVFDLVLL